MPFDPDAIFPLQRFPVLDFTHLLVNSELANFLGKAVPWIEVGFAEEQSRKGVRPRI